MDLPFMMDQPAAMPDLSLAGAELDLTSWLFQDDVSQLDFCEGAKDAHSLPSKAVGSASPPFITSQVLPDWMETSDDLNWDEPINIEQCFSDDLKKHQLLDEIPAFPSSLLNDYELCKNNSLLYNVPQQIFADSSLPEYEQFPINQSVEEEPQNVDLFSGNAGDGLYQDSFKQELQQSPVKHFVGENHEIVDQVTGNDIVQPHEVTEILFHEPNIYAVPEDSSMIDEQDQFECVEEVVSTEETAPRIITVPVSDALQRPIIKTICISKSDFSEVQPPLKLAPIFISGQNQQQLHQPRKIVIKLKKISRPSQSIPLIVQPIAKTEPTLKEILESDQADQLIHDLVVPITEDSSNDCQLLYSDSESGFEESASSFIFSPSSYVSSDAQLSDCPDSPYAEDEQSPRSQRSAPYSLTERKLRKKEQNKRAAIRYRYKKKEEGGTVLQSLQREERKHLQLKEKFDSLSLEVNLMKKLMKDVIAAQVKK